jgi:hypothetical protein
MNDVTRLPGVPLAVRQSPGPGEVSRDQYDREDGGAVGRQVRCHPAVRDKRREDEPDTKDQVHSMMRLITHPERPSDALFEAKDVRTLLYEFLAEFRRCSLLSQ